MIQSFRHEFKGWGIHPSSCNVYIEKNLDTQECLILFEDINDGTSVTNASEQLATELVKLLELDHPKCRFFETYDGRSSIDEIEYNWKNNKADHPKWKPCNDKNILKLFK